MNMFIECLTWPSFNLIQYDLLRLISRCDISTFRSTLCFCYYVFSIISYVYIDIDKYTNEIFHIFDYTVRCHIIVLI